MLESLNAVDFPLHRAPAMFFQILKVSSFIRSAIPSPSQQYCMGSSGRGSLECCVSPPPTKRLHRDCDRTAGKGDKTSRCAEGAGSSASQSKSEQVRASQSKSELDGSLRTFHSKSMSPSESCQVDIPQCSSSWHGEGRDHSETTSGINKWPQAAQALLASVASYVFAAECRFTLHKYHTIEDC
ncbi:hypothetical protein CC80DRAFT_9340 [Byssothecium circinans]|uniref:Uncharacterized protein n=1 Tax=Byssothecium circinans TaxID=147558 RepID=A0A6A5UI01_9PLEO|nr:hypothetical protein CC80DRAFT_9340 [Byssothecium circinans]